MKLCLDMFSFEKCGSYVRENFFTWELFSRLEWKIDNMCNQTGPWKKQQFFFNGWLNSSWPNGSLSCLSPCHRKFHLMQSNPLMAPARMENKDIMFVGSASRIKFVRVSLSPLDKIWVFHLANFYSHFSITVSQISIDFDLAPKGIPKWMVGKDPISPPRIDANRFMQGTLLMG